MIARVLNDRYRPGLPWRRRRILLAVGVVAPVFAFLSVLLAVAFYPGFNHATQFLSELGGATARYPFLFNGGVLISGVAAGFAGVGFGLAVMAIGGSRIAAGGLIFCFVMAGIGLVISSLFVWPNPIHLFVNLGLGIILAPLFLIWGLHGVPGMRGLRIFLILVCIAMALLALITNHRIWYGLVNPQNVGWWERLFAIVLVGWTGIAALVLERRLFALALPPTEPKPAD
ncbi:MAG: DUF998 domain-containing protein [Caulobacter sp.]